MSTSQRATRSASVTTAATSPTFSTGTSSLNNNESNRATFRARRSTRRAAAVASTRIAEASAPQRRSTRLASRGGGASGTVTGRTGGAGRTTPPARRNAANRGTKETPIVLDDEEIDEMDLKPAAKAVAGSLVVGGVETAPQKPPADFTCAICLDAPSTMTEVARISGCTHQFCFDCIDKWAATENKCPCCKERFRTIDRVVSLPEEASPRRPKRKRQNASTGSNTRARRGEGGSAASTARSNRRVNSRTVEDRNQQSMSAFPINAAIVEQILASFSNLGGSLRGTGQVTFGTSEDGRPAIRMIRPSSGGMVGVMEMFLPDEVATGGNGSTASARGSGAARASGVARGSGAASAGRGSSPTRTARVRFSRSSVGSSRRGSSSSGSGGAFGSGLPPPLSFRLTESTSESASLGEGGARRSSGVARPPGRVASAGSSRAGSRARSQGFASLFASLGSGSMSSPSSRRASSSPDAASSGTSPGAGGSTNGISIRIIARDRAASNRRGSGSNDSGSSNDEPIVID
mmetsp:Transcript_6151/g.11013  ORF Transcript_6151/g.11013 Transcript_6151/m.11013 type:complete len:521 (+) Transcript_6151:280-1842(+)